MIHYGQKSKLPGKVY